VEISVDLETANPRVKRVPGPRSFLAFGQLAPFREDPLTFLLGMMINGIDEETGARMTDRQLPDEITTFLLAGHETTSNALCWTFHLLAEHPSVLNKLQQSIVVQPVPGEPCLPLALITLRPQRGLNLVVTARVEAQRQPMEENRCATGFNVTAD